jgi:hypothetical protein
MAIPPDREESAMEKYNGWVNYPTWNDEVDA